MQAKKTLFTKRATALGEYYTSDLSRTALLHYLRGCAATRFKSASDDRRWWENNAELRSYLRGLGEDFLKKADLGGDQEQGFEQSFSSLAYSYLKDKSPRLLDFIVGFQLVDRNEDSTKAMGLFGFKVGSQWLYAPCFFINGDLKGHELLYIKKQDRFVPQKENWVNYLISRKPHTLGEGSDKNTFELGGLMPNLIRLAKMPTGTKYGSDANAAVHFDDWSKPMLPLVAAMFCKQAKALYPEHAGESELNFKAVVEQPFKAAMAATAAATDLKTFLGSFPLLKMAFEKCYRGYPLLKHGFDRFYGPDFFLKMAQAQRLALDSLVTRATPKQAEAYIAPPKKKGDPFNIMPEREEECEKEGALEVIALDLDVDSDNSEPGGLTVNKKELTDSEREKLLKDTVLIKDERKITSIAYNTQVHLELTNPDATGLFEILEKPGSFDDMLVICNPHTGRGREDFSVVVRKSDPRAWKNTDRTNLWAKQNRQPTDTDYKEWVESLDGVDSLKKGGTYIAISPHGEGTCPFEVREDYGDGAYKVSWDDYVSYSESKRKSGLVSKSRDWDVGYSPWNAKLTINKRKGSKLRSNNGELSIPDTFKILKVKDPPKPRKNKDSLVDIACCSYPEGSGGESETTPIQPGNLLDVQLLLHKEARQLKITDTGGSEVWLKTAAYTERMSKKAALICLVRDHGLREIQARQMLKEASQAAVHGRSAAFLIKYALGYNGDLQSGAPTAPAIPEPMRGTEQNGPYSVNAIYPQEELLPVDSMSSQLSDPQIYDPFFEPDQSAMQVAQQASQQGQKEVFDTSMIAGMLKSVRQESLVDKYLGDLMTALDKLGRILFMFYWHNEEFEDRYGKADLPELEDSLRNAFETLGDVTLFLMEKTVKGGQLINQGAGVGNSNKSEPSVEEAARN